MINEENNVFKEVFLLLIPVLFVVAFFIIRYTVVLPNAKFNNFEKMYSGSLNSKSRYNNYEVHHIAVDELISRIFHDFKNKMLNDPREACNYINKKAKSILFEDCDGFEKFVEKNDKKLSASYIVRYSSNVSTFKVLDQNNYKYSFEYTNPVDYKVTIDLYK